MQRLVGLLCLALLVAWLILPPKSPSAQPAQPAHADPYRLWVALFDVSRLTQAAAAPEDGDAASRAVPLAQFDGLRTGDQRQKGPVSVAVGQNLDAMLMSLHGQIPYVLTVRVDREEGAQDMRVVNTLLLPGEGTAVAGPGPGMLTVIHCYFPQTRH